MSAEEIMGLVDDKLADKPSTHKQYEGALKFFKVIF
jgi:hypothetical protein